MVVRTTGRVSVPRRRVPPQSIPGQTVWVAASSPVRIASHVTRMMRWTGGSFVHHHSARIIPVQASSLPVDCQLMGW